MWLPGHCWSCPRSQNSLSWRFGHLPHDSLWTLCETQPFLMVLSVTPVKFCHRYLSHPAISHVIAGSFSHQLGQLNLRPGPGQWPAAPAVLAAFTGGDDLPAPILACRAFNFLLKGHIMLISLKQEADAIITVHLMKNKNAWNSGLNELKATGENRTDLAFCIYHIKRRNHFVLSL